MRPPAPSAPTRGRPGWLATAAGLLIALGCLWAYGDSLDAPFVLDDLPNIVDNPSVRARSLAPAELLRAADPPPGLSASRAVAYLTFAANHALGGYDPWGYRVVNVGLLIASALVLMGFAYLLVRRLAPDVNAGLAAAGAAALWALHPLATNHTTYLVQRMTALAVLGWLGAFACVLLAERRGRSWLFGAAACVGLGALAKEIAWLWPLAVLGYQAAAGQLPGWVARRRRLAVASAAGLGAVALAAALWWVLPQYDQQAYTLGQRLLTQARVVAFYLGLFFWPHPELLSIDHGVAVSTGLWTPPSTLLALGLHAGLLGLAAWLWRRDRLLSLLIGLFYLHHLPESSIVPLDLIFEHRMALPGVFLAIGVAYGAVRLAGDRRHAAVAVGGLLLVAAAALAVATHARNQVWTSGLSLWQDAARKAPGNHRARTNLGVQHLLRGDLAGARAELETAVGIEPRYAVGWVNLGIVRSELGDCEEALTALGRAKALGYRRAPVYYNAGVCLQDLGRHAEALAEYEEALRLAPWTPDARLNMALILLGRGAVGRAEALVREELRVNPGNGEARELLGQLTGPPFPSGGEAVR